MHSWFNLWYFTYVETFFYCFFSSAESKLGLRCIVVFTYWFVLFSASESCWMEKHKTWEIIESEIKKVKFTVLLARIELIIAVNHCRKRLSPAKVWMNFDCKWEMSVNDGKLLCDYSQMIAFRSTDERQIDWILMIQYCCFYIRRRSASERA